MKVMQKGYFPLANPRATWASFVRGNFKFGN